MSLRDNTTDIDNTHVSNTAPHLPQTPTITFNFTLPPSLHPFHTSLKSYLTAHPTIARLIASAIVIHNNRVLLVQRAATDGFPLAWECPGGSVDSSDATILHGLARELFEESGLVVRRVVGLVDDGTEFEGREGVWRKVTCLVEVEVDGEGKGEGDGMPKVVLEPSEHQNYVWATEEEVEGGWAGGTEVKFAYEVQRETIRAAFRMAGEEVKRGAVH